MDPFPLVPSVCPQEGLDFTQGEGSGGPILDLAEKEAIRPAFFIEVSGHHDFPAKKPGEFPALFDGIPIAVPALLQSFPQAGPGGFWVAKDGGGKGEDGKAFHKAKVPQAAGSVNFCETLDFETKRLYWGGMTVRERSDGYGWILDGVMNGARFRRTFTTKEEAMGEKARLSAQARRLGDRVAGLDPATVAEWLRLDDKCKVAGGDLAKAVEFYLSSLPDGGEIVTPAELMERWKAAHDETRGGRHKFQVGYQWRDFLTGLDLAEGCGIRAITSGHVARHLDRPEWSAATRRSRLAGISAVLGWAQKQGFLNENPAAKIPRPELRMEDEVRFLSIPECKALLAGFRAAAVADPRNRDCLLYLVLGMFLGLRRREIESAQVMEVDMVAREFVVPLGKTSARKIYGRRSRKRRTVEMEPVALAWMEEIGILGMDPAARVCGVNFRKRWEGIRKEVMEQWPPNPLRATYATYHYAMFRDESRLQANMGHDSVAVLHQHYRGLARRNEAEEFWGLFPGAI